MQALDFEIDGQRASRLDVVKKVFRGFVNGEDGSKGRPDDSIGLVDFGGYAEAKCPLTLDHGALDQLLDQVKIPEPIMDSQGRVINERLLRQDLSTAIGDALTLAVDRLQSVKAKSKIVILLSDGESNSGVVTPEEAAAAAKAYGIKVYTIGIGTNSGSVPFETTDSYGHKILVPQQVSIDEGTLKMIADRTGGRYYNAQDTETLKNIYTEIDSLEKTSSEGRLYSEYGEYFEYALFPGLALILAHVILISTRFRSLP
jgi:Ca-activated chloride channel family protein